MALKANAFPLSLKLICVNCATNQQLLLLLYETLAVVGQVQPACEAGASIKPRVERAFASGTLGKVVKEMAARAAGDRDSLRQ